MARDGQRRIGAGENLDHRHLLQETLAVARLQAQFTKLLDQIRDRLLLAGRAGLSALEAVGSQHSDMLAKDRFVDVGGRRRELRMYRTGRQQQARRGKNAPITPNSHDIAHSSFSCGAANTAKPRHIGRPRSPNAPSRATGALLPALGNSPRWRWSKLRMRSSSIRAAAIHAIDRGVGPLRQRTRSGRHPGRK